jgi:hypothetical protein
LYLYSSTTSSYDCSYESSSPLSSPQLFHSLSTESLRIHQHTLLQAAAALTAIDVTTGVDALAPLTTRRLEHDMILEHGITSCDIEMVYLSPSCDNNAFEEELDI